MLNWLCCEKSSVRLPSQRLLFARFDLHKAATNTGTNNKADEQQQTKSNERMALPRASITTIKSNLNNALSAKDPHGIASAVDLPPLPTRVLGTSGDGDGNSQQQHQEYLKIDSVDWSNVLNPLLDAHSAIQAVCDQPCFGANFF